ncbi:MAG TPA: diaminopropionate ammonia-lyase [Acidobacteriota bacterium]|nr:diaminopropionate ammonia-lyase [Acidobacteriota bacterium]
MCDYLINPHRRAEPDFDSDIVSAFESRDIFPFHQALPGYAPTPLLSLPTLAGRLGLRRVLVKDESHRLGLSAFKVLGASYAIYRFLKRRSEAATGKPFEIADFFRRDQAARGNSVTFCTATDGNHGRAVAWTAKLVGQRAVIYMPRGSVRARVESIEKENAKVFIVDGNYDDAVKQAAADADLNGWQIISDTAYPGYMEIPAWVQAGYTTLFREIDESLAGSPAVETDVVFIQSGVGSLAAAAAWHNVRGRSGRRPGLVNVEPSAADCLLASARSSSGDVRSTTGSRDTIMAGLNCGTPSLVAWPVVKQVVDVFMSIPDRFSKRAMRTFYHPGRSDERIESGESGAAGLGALLALCEAASLAPAREALGLGSDSTILLINTEGATDPVNFRKVVNVD